MDTNHIAVQPEISQIIVAVEINDSNQIATTEINDKLLQQRLCKKINTHSKILILEKSKVVGLQVPIKSLKLLANKSQLKCKVLGDQVPIKI